MDVTPRTHLVVVWLTPLAILGACGAGVYGVVSSRPAPVTLPPPPLLAGAGGGFGNFSECSERVGGACPGVSPELERRLYQRFPAGSPEAALVTVLTEQGFEAPTAFPRNPSVHFASYSPPPSDSGPSPASVYATVYWKVDDQGGIVWMHGYVRWLSL